MLAARMVTALTGKAPPTLARWRILVMSEGGTIAGPRADKTGSG
jgi:L-asparaginase/Glu-tRNA(Gln) amidotransferase subunit D